MEYMYILDFMKRRQDIVLKTYITVEALDKLTYYNLIPIYRFYNLENIKAENRELRLLLHVILLYICK